MYINILSFDTSTKLCSVALIYKKKIYCRYVFNNNQHTKYILTIIDNIFQKFQIKLNTLHAIAFGIGPGSFTGIRISASIAQGLAIGLNLPLISISSIKILAQGCLRRTGLNKVISIINATSKKIYLGRLYKIKSFWKLFQKILILKKKVIKYNIFNSLSGKWVVSNNFFIKNIQCQYQKSLTLVPCNVNFPNAIDAIPLAILKYKQKKVISPKKISINYMYEYLNK